MKILIANDCGKSAHYYERLGLARAFTACGHECIIWDTNTKSEFDAFDEFEPDIFIGQSYRITNALIRCIKERPALKVIMKAGEWGQSCFDINNQKFPVLIATEKEKELVEKLKQETNKPDFLFIHYHPDFIDYTHGTWKPETNVVSLMNAADIFSFTRGIKQDKYECDIMFLGGYWGYKSQTLSKYILPLCENFKYKIKIFGNSAWPCPQYCGFLPEGEEANALASAKICLNIHEPHSQVYGYDIVERPFKLFSNKCFMVGDYVEGLNKLFGDRPTLCKSPKEFIKNVEYFLKNWNNIQDQINNTKEHLFQETIKNHTYFDRIASIFKNLDLLEEYNKTIDKKEEVIKKLNIV